jgi:hypothetical protein
MNRFFFLAPLFLCLAVSLPAFGAKDKDKAADKADDKTGKAAGKAAAPAVTVIQVTGVVRLVGSANFPELLIDNSQEFWYIARDEADKLHDLQHRTVTVEGEETVTEMKFGNGLSAGIRRDLKNIRIISVD